MIHSVAAQYGAARSGGCNFRSVGLWPKQDGLKQAAKAIAEKTENRRQKTTTNVRENRCMKLFSPDASSPRLMRNN
jgi:hypothetical protein